MKLVVAMVEPHQVEAVTGALDNLEVLSADGQAEQVANTIVDDARTGKIGDEAL